MTIKNPHIIHFIRKRKEGFFEGEYAYICFGSYTKEKSTKRKDKVTCLNCLHLLKKEKENERKTKFRT